MISLFILSFIVFIYDVSSYVPRNLSCGLDNSQSSIVYEGFADVKTYPWMGTLFYPIRKKKIATTVVLISKQIVIGAANEIDTLPKDNVRARSRVVLGHKCSGPGIKILDYVFHPEYKHDSYTALALVQLDVDLVKQVLTPICPPPVYFLKPQIYAMIIGDCNKGKVRVYKMIYAPKEQCEHIYRKSGLNMDKYWPSHSACARTQGRGTCKWRSGTALVIKQDGRWSLLGFGMNGPGCRTPTLFLDYGMYHQWVRNSVVRIGSPAITRMGENHIIMRRSLNKLQRFGSCDLEEQNHELYRDDIKIESAKPTAEATYNLTLISNMEYSCIILKADIPEEPEKLCGEVCQPPSRKPRINLRRWCTGTKKICHGLQFLDINLYVQIDFKYSTNFKMVAYGKFGKFIDPLKASKYANSYIARHKAKQLTHERVLWLMGAIKNGTDDHDNYWFDY